MINNRLKFSDLSWEFYVDSAMFCLCSKSVKLGIDEKQFYAVMVALWIDESDHIYDKAIDFAI